MIRKVVSYLNAVWGELRACQWPDLRHVTGGSLFVIYSSFGLLAFLVCVDYVAEGVFGLVGVRERPVVSENLQSDD